MGRVEVFNPSAMHINSPNRGSKFTNNMSLLVDLPGQVSGCGKQPLSSDRLLVLTAWGTVCGHWYWDNDIVADIVCKKVGLIFRSAIEAVRGANG